MPITLGMLRASGCWAWVCCQNPKCLRMAPVAITPLIIRWGSDTPSDVLRQCAKRSRCGRKGATLQIPSWSDTETGLMPFPEGK